ncbi:amidase [Piscinibacter gummiphilus]|uniref:Amidase n=1 Tax=Piscinibacter gummiphilus TaxID=946333 RepID=A0ABZ0CMZ9_9BURK|nr:amidase [Piscinibacter gummiphilus]WOB06233.1 amidase [Piscinibacter gummiphilus]
MSDSSADNAICRMDAVTLAKRIRSKELSATEVTEAVLRRMDVLEPHIHAFCTPTPEVARAAAKAVDAQIAKGEPIGPLAGVPIGIKDLVATKGIKTVMGSKLYEEFIPDEDDIVVERLKAAGAVIIGKTNVPEFGYSGVGHNPVFETTRNPWNLAMTSGGSSAGSGASVATGVAPFAIGSDGGGSVRIPSAHCGLYGIKASMGRVALYPGCRDERYPGVSSWETLEHIGPMSRTVADSALMLSVIAGPDPRDRYSIPAADFDYLEAAQPSSIKGLRIAYSEDWGYAAVDPEVRRVVSEAVAVFEKELGCHVERANPGWRSDAGATFWTLVAADTDLTGMRKLIAGREHEISPHLVDLVMKPWTGADFTDAHTQRKAICNTMWRFMSNYDLLITPTLAVPPFPVHMQGPEIIEGRMGRNADWLCFTFPANLTGQPAASIPAGFTKDGLPVGLQIIGRHLDDRTVLRASAAFEQARPWAQHWPALLDQLGL